VLDEGQGDVLGDRQRGEQRAFLEQHAKAPLDQRPFVLGQARQVLAEHFHVAFAGPAQADDAAQQHRFAAAGAADHGENFAFVQVQVEVLVHALAAEAIAQATDFDHRLGRYTG